MAISNKYRLHGEVLCKFANAKNTDEAGKIFKESVKKALHYPSDELKDCPEEPFPTLEEFRKNEIENNKNLNKSQKTLIEDFIKNHPSHLHYEYYAGSCSFRGLQNYYEIHNLYKPIIYYVEKESDTFSPDNLTFHNVGTPMPLAKKQKIKGKWADTGNGYKIYIGAFDQKINKASKKYKLTEKEARSVINILHYYFDVLEPEHNHISRIQKELKNVLDVLAGTKKFDDAAVSTLQKYEQIQTETNFNVSYITANGYGGIVIEDWPPFIEESFLNRCDGCVHLNLQDYYDVTIIFCFFKFFREENNHKYIKKCISCDDFFIAEDTRRTKCYSSECMKKYEREKKRKQRENDPVTYL